MHSDNALRSATFKAYDGGGNLVATVKARGQQSLLDVRVIGSSADSTAADLDAQHIERFSRDLEEQITGNGVYRLVQPNSNGAVRTVFNPSRTQSGTQVWYRSRSAVISIGILVVIVMVAALVFALQGNSVHKNDGMIAIPDSAESFKGKDYNDIVTQLKAAGFTNVSTQAQKDLITGWVHKENSVVRVSVNGSTDYSASDRFAPNTKIVVTYHAFASQGSTDGSSTESNATPSNSASASASSTQTPSSNTATSSSASANAAPKTPATITTANNPEFAALLQSVDSASAATAFANKYQGQTIEFDGNIASLMQDPKYTTLYILLITAGNYSTTSTKGPNFRFNDVNYSQLHLTGKNIPSSITQGLNIHLLAKVESYSDSNGLFELEPVSMSIR
jgi:sensor c-di-GMP phosphodiesterase-like protein